MQHATIRAFLGVLKGMAEWYDRNIPTGWPGCASKVRSWLDTAGAGHVDESVKTTVIKWIEKWRSRFAMREREVVSG